MKVKGNCDSCGADFGSIRPASVEQEVSLKCSSCSGEVRYCRNCKEKGCPNCGGSLTNGFDRRPDIMY